MGYKTIANRSYTKTIERHGTAPACAHVAAILEISCPATFTNSSLNSRTNDGGKPAGDTNSLQKLAMPLIQEAAAEQQARSEYTAKSRRRW